MVIINLFISDLWYFGTTVCILWQRGPQKCLHWWIPIGAPSKLWLFLGVAPKNDSDISPIAPLIFTVGQRSRNMVDFRPSLHLKRSGFETERGTWGYNLNTHWERRWLAQIWLRHFPIAYCLILYQLKKCEIWHPLTFEAPAFQKGSNYIDKKKSSSGDEIANVNFLYDDIVHALKI